jgi:hypothetical protein
VQVAPETKPMPLLRGGSDPIAAFSGVLDRLRENSLEHFGTAPVRIECVGMKEGRYSTALHIRVRDSSHVQGAFVKRYKLRDYIPEYLQRQVLAEHEVLFRGRDSLAEHPGFTVAEPIACFPEEFTLVTREAPGQTVRAVMVNGLATWWLFTEVRHRLRDVFQRLGLWVKAFQKAGPQGQTISIPNLRGYLDERLRLLVDLGELTPGNCRALRSRFDRYSEQVRDSDLRAAARHGDFHSTNLLVSRSVVTAIDPLPAGMESIYYDLARMFMHLEYLKARPWAAPVVEDAQAAMLRAFDPDLRPGRPLFQMELMRHIVCLMLQDCQQQPLGPRAVTVRRVYRALGWRSNRKRLREWQLDGSAQAARLLA